MKHRAIDDMKTRFINWSTEELVRATTIDKGNYRADAVIFLNDELNARNTSQQEIDRIHAEVKAAAKEEVNAVSGLKGFLLLFVLVVAGSSLCMVLAGAMSFINYPSVVSFVVSLPLFGVGSYGIYAFILLVLKKANAPKHAGNWIKYSIIYAILVSVANYFASGDIPFHLTATCLFAALWSSYLSWSKQVESTYECKHEGNKTVDEIDESSGDRRVLMSLDIEPALPAKPVTQHDEDMGTTPNTSSRAEKTCGRLVLISALVAAITFGATYSSPWFAPQLGLIAKISAVIFSILVLVWIGLICKGGSRVAYLVSLVLIGGGIPTAVIYGPYLDAWLSSKGLSLANIAWTVGGVVGGITFVSSLFSRKS